MFTFSIILNTKMAQELAIFFMKSLGFCILSFNTMVADDLTMEGARAWAARVLT